MAWQRWCESARHFLRRHGRLGVVGALLFGLTACETVKDPFGPTRIPGRGGSNTSNSTLVGEWEVTLVVTVGGDIQTWTTNWRFRSDRSCTWHQEIASTLEGATRERTRDCTWTESNSVINIIYQDTGSTAALPYSFPAFDSNRLILEGVEYRRIS